MSKIAVCGSLNNGDVILAELLISYGFDVSVIRQVGNDFKADCLSKQLKYVSNSNLIYIKNSREFIKTVLNYNLVLSITGGINGLMSYFYDWITYLPFFPRIISLTTGSDITELALERSFKGFRYRRLLNKSFHCYLSPYIRMLPAIAKLKLNNYSILRCPYYLLNSDLISSRPEGEQITILHASNIDWGGNNKQRVSTKGSDKFIRAFIKATKEGLNAKCIILDRGPNKEDARNIIKSNNAEDVFEFIPQVTHKELLELFNSCDVVADQFDGGATGGIGFEAMAVGKPVMVYYDLNITQMAYDNPPPVINVKDESEIYNALMRLRDKDKIINLGAEAAQWVKDNINIYHANFSELVLRVCVATDNKFEDHIKTRGKYR